MYIGHVLENYIGMFETQRSFLRYILSISLLFEHAYSVDFYGNCVLQIRHSRKVPAASRLQCIPGRAISVKLHPQEVLAAKFGMEYACSKRCEIDSS